MRRTTGWNQRCSHERARARRVLHLVLLVVMLVSVGCRGDGRGATPTPMPTQGPTAVAPTTQPATAQPATAVPTAPPRAGVSAQREAGKGFMQFVLSEGKELLESAARVPLAQGQPLSPADAQKILDRLPPLPADERDAQEFRLPERSLPAPRPGETITQTFPPAEGAPRPTEPAAGPLKVLRFSPEGNVPLAPFLSVTFDQPMVPLTSHRDLAAKDVPVKLTPLPEGTWRWLGTQTLMFEPVTRFPMATRYNVEIPAGTTSATGGKLAETVRWSFTTPPPQVTAFYPSAEPTVRDPLIFAAFDQRINPAAVLSTIKVIVGGKSYALRMATTTEVQANETVQGMAARAGEGRWLAFKATELLPYAATVTVNIGPGTPSDEGPLTTESATTYVFTTYGPLKVNQVRCGWEEECRPLAPWFVTFSNPLDVNAFDAAMVQVSPELPGLQASISGNTLTIRGRSKGQTTYHVTLKAGLADIFGQTLEADQTLSIRVGSARATLYAPVRDFTVLDPSSAPKFSVFSMNYGTLLVRIYAVEPEDWPAYWQYRNESRRQQGAPNPPGRKVLDTKVRVENVADELVETSIDLRPHLKDGRGQLILIVEPEPSLLQALRPNEQLPKIQIWVQATRIALDAFVDGEQLLAWASSLADGAPLKDVEIKVYPGGRSAKSGADGLAVLPLPEGARTESGGYLVARQGQDNALLPENIYGWGSGWRRNPPQDEYRWYVMDDRHMYRPGEKAYIKGWVRLVRVNNKEGDALTLPGSGSVSYELTDARGNRLLNGTMRLNALGGFNTTLTLPTTMNLGTAWLRLTLDGRAAQTVHQIQVQEFRRPEFEVSAKASEGPHYVGGQATTTVKASYYAGGPLANADVRWQVTSTPGTYRPPKWDDFIFGIWRPWWESPVLRGAPSIMIEPVRKIGETVSKTYTARTDASGSHTLRLDLIAVDPPQPIVMRAEATVMDVNRQAWSASTQLLVHPSTLYVGLRSTRTFVELGQPIVMEVIVTDIDGKAIAGKAVQVRAVRVQSVWEKGQWVEKEFDEQLCNTTSADKPVSCSFATREGGSYRITATVRDERDRPNLTQLTRWVTGGRFPVANRVEQEKATLIPDRQEYQPGQTAEILVQSPFVPAEGLLTVRRLGIVSTERFRMDKPSYTLRVPIEEAFIPNVQIQVDLVGAAPRADSTGQPDPKLPPRPAYATGTLMLSVPAYAHTLSLSVTPRDKELEPGGETVVEVLVKDAQGKPVQGAELVVVVVDEAILALTNYQLADPIAAFYPQRYPSVRDHYLRSYVLLVDPNKLQEEAVVMATAEKAADAVPRAMAPAAAPTMAAGRGGGAEEAQPIRVRSDFDPLAIFEPAVPTDAQGRASVRVKVPDNLTRYRVMVVAVAGEKRYGKGESAITARLPLMVRPSPPRFLNFGDRFELPVVLQNQTDAPMQVDVVVRGQNVRLLGSAGLRVSVPTRDRVEVRFPVETVSAGTARFQVGAVSGRWADAASFALPVYTPATTEAFAVYGTVDAGAIAQPVIAPSGAFTQFGALQISTSSTALQALTDAFLYLISYPFECSEQIASRVLSVAALRDVLEAFKAKELPPRSEIDAAMERDIAKLNGMQNANGSFPLWQRGGEAWPYHSIHVAHALARAEAKGYQVPKEMKARSLDYLRKIESQYPQYYSEEVRNTCTAYALYVRALWKDVDTARARRMVREVGLDKLQPEAIGWLLNVLAQDKSPELAEISRHLNNRVVETAGAAHFTTSYRETDGYLLLASNRRADGIILEGLIQAEPRSDLIPKIVRGLLAHRKQGRWGNTQENVFILLALDRYFAAYEAQSPDFVARVWLGEQYVAGFEFRGRTTEYQEVSVPMSYLAQRQGAQPLLLSKEGKGRLYYRLGLTYAPKDLDLAPMDQGFTVLRSYEAVDDPLDVRQDEKGVWHVRAGARVRVRIRMIAPTRRYHVALVDPLPAGFEALNPALAVSGSIPQDPQDTRTGRYWWWWRTWYEHQNLRDERAEAFASLLWEGIHTYTYVARATTPGTFIVPPPKAEEMYSPEVFGRGATDRVVVEER